MRYEDFVLQLDAGAQGDYRARVLSSPFGEGGTSFRLPFEAADASSALAPQGMVFASAGPVLLRGAPEPVPFTPSLHPLEVGAGLYRTLFQGQVRSLFDKSRGRLELEPDLCLRLKIKLDPNDPATATLADLPWELLFDEEVEDHFGLLRQTTLIRYLDVPRRTPPIPFTPPLRILAVGASPSNLPGLNLDEECGRLEELERREPGVEVRFLRNASSGEVRQTLAEGGFHVLHFMGHGDFDGISGEGLLFFEQPDRSPERVSGRAFAARLKDLRSLGVVTLNACNTARALHQAGHSPFRGVATALVLGGLPAVVAMQHPISDQAAIGFSSAFYRQLARGVPIDNALTEGRQAILSADPDGSEWAIPVLFLRVADGSVFVARPAPEPEARIEPPSKPEPSPETPSQGAPAVPALFREPASSLVTPASKSGWPLPKVAGVAGGALVLAVGIYAGLQQFSRSRPSEGLPAGGDTSDSTSEVVDIERHSPIQSPGTKRSDSRQGRQPAGETSQGSELSTRDIVGQGNGLTGSAKPEPPPTASVMAGAKDLKASLVSLTPRDGGGWQATIAFTNNSSLSLSLTLGQDGCMLSGGGRSYGPLGSDLPGSDDGFRLSIPAGGRAQHTLDFPEMKQGITKVVLALATSEGDRIPVASSSVDLDTPAGQ